MQATGPGIRAMEAQLERWDEEVDWVVSRAREARVDVQAGNRSYADELREKHRRARSMLAEFKASGSESWAAFMSGAGFAWRDLEAEFAKWSR